MPDVLPDSVPVISPQRLYLIQLSTTSVPIHGGTLEMQLGCYLIQMSDGTNILIDSGLPADYVPQPGTPPSENKTDVISQLDRLGLTPDHIDIVICTHFDTDHAGYHDAFTKAKFIVQREHYELALSGQAGHARYASVRTHWDHPALHYRLVDGDNDLYPGLTLVETSGHAPGHQSVLVRLPHTGVVLLAIDAVAMERFFKTTRKMSPVDDNEDQLRASTQKLLDIVSREKASLVVFGHDGTQWRTLKKSPAYYD